MKKREEIETSKPVSGTPNNPFPVTLRGKIERIHPEEERERAKERYDLRTQEGTRKFMERTRRYYRLTHLEPTTQYAKGLDSKPEDFA